MRLTRARTAGLCGPAALLALAIGGALLCLGHPTWALLPLLGAAIALTVGLSLAERAQRAGGEALVRPITLLRRRCTLGTVCLARLERTPRWADPLSPLQYLVVSGSEPCEPTLERTGEYFERYVDAHHRFLELAEELGGPGNPIAA